MLTLIRVREIRLIAWDTMKKLLLPMNRPVNSAIEPRDYFNEEK